MIDAIKRWLRRGRKDHIPEPRNLDFGSGFRAKQLIDGSWTLWFGDKVCDLRSPGFLWRPGDRWFAHCKAATWEELEAVAKECMALQGVPMPPPKEKITPSA